MLLQFGSDFALLLFAVTLLNICALYVLML